MKKYILGILAVFMCLTLVACSSNDEKEDIPQNNVEISDSESDEIDISLDEPELDEETSYEDETIEEEYNSDEEYYTEEG